jgi:NAD(P)-dependent dehydrogenase (short-subunit alcohol dehydrogenase family)
MDTVADLKLQGKTAIVFGSTRKIGRHVALAYAAAGANVVLTGRAIESGERVLREIAELGGSADFVQTDITHYGSVDRAVHRAVDRFGRLDVMVASASGLAETTRGFTLFSQMPPEELLEYSLTHWIAKAYCVKAALQPMIDGGGGSMILITSDAGRAPTVGESMIGGGAAACIQMARTLAKEFLRWKITINTIAVSHTDTGDLPDTSPNAFTAKMREKLIVRQTIPVTGGHVAAAAVYLGSDAARAMTGQVFSINGGIST